MTTDELLDQICMALNLAPGSVGLQDTNKTVTEWDSIGHLSIISMLANNFGSIVEDEDFLCFTSVGVLVDRLRNRNLLEDCVPSDRA